MVTLQDVADKAGVSPATVSRVVRGEGKVGDKCRAHVKKIVEKMGYRPNTNARALASNKTEIVGIIVPNIASPFFGALAIGAEEAATKAKYKVLMGNSHNDSQTEKDLLDSFMEQGCQNIILHSKFTDDKTIIKWANEIKGLVVINRFIPEIANRCIWLDNVSGGRQIAEHLVTKGHKKFALITSHLKISDPQDRIIGIRQALSREGIELPESNIIYNNAGMEAGETAVDELLARGVEFTALICFNDSVAIGAINRLYHHGHEVPKNVSVVGFDDVIISKICRPKLTTMKYPIAKMAIYATNLSMELTNKNNEQEENKTHLFMASLTERASVKDN
jgi:LacI family transcriptional regulator